jgi:DNA-binding NarL/FixJ family response regulator
VLTIQESACGSSDAAVQRSDGIGDSPVKVITVVLAGHHPLTLCGLRQVFENEADCAVLAVCTDIEGSLEALRQYRPDVLILDVDRNGALAALRSIQRERLGSRVVVLVSAADEAQMLDAARLGGAIVQKELPPDALLSCIRSLWSEKPLDVPGIGRLATRLTKAGTTTRSGRHLTPREAEIARLAARGASTRDIATRLDVKQGTVKIHLHSIYEKLNVGGRLGLILVARRRGLA